MPRKSISARTNQQRADLKTVKNSAKSAVARGDQGAAGVWKNSATLIGRQLSIRPSRSVVRRRGK